MPKVSVNILTKDRAAFLPKALDSVLRQTFQDYEVIIVDDGSTDETGKIIEAYKHINILTIKHKTSLGIIASRQEALLAAQGEYIAILDDDDQWIDEDKLARQAKFLDQHQEYALVGGGIQISNSKFLISKQIPKSRPKEDEQIRRTMLFRNNFFTSTVMFRKETALWAGGFVKDEFDLGEDYDLWLRMGKLGKMYNFREAFTLYTQPSYNKGKLRQFLTKQLKLINRHKGGYPYYFIAKIILTLRNAI